MDRDESPLLSSFTTGRLRPTKDLHILTIFTGCCLRVRFLVLLADHILFSTKPTEVCKKLLGCVKLFIGARFCMWPHAPGNGNLDSMLTQCVCNNGDCDHGTDGEVG